MIHHPILCRKHPLALLALSSLLPLALMGATQAQAQDDCERGTLADQEARHAPYL